MHPCQRRSTMTIIITIIDNTITPLPLHSTLCTTSHIIPPSPSLSFLSSQLNAPCSVCALFLPSIPPCCHHHHLIANITLIAVYSGWGVFSPHRCSVY